MKKLPLFLLLLFLFQLSVHPKIKSKGIPFIRNFTKRDYKGGTQNWDMVQTANGLMYFANNEGVLEYDGREWRKIPMPNFSLVRSLAVDTSQRVYVGAYNEFGFLEPDEKGRMGYHSLVNLLPEESRNFDDIWQIFPMDNGVLFHSFQATFFYKDGKISKISPSTEYHFSFRIGDQIFVREKHLGLSLLEGRKFRLVPGGEFFRDVEIVAMLPLSENRILIATARQGLFLFDGKEFISWAVPTNLSLKKHQIFCGVRIRESHYALGTVRNGIYILNREGKLVQHINADKGLQNNTVLNLFVDRNENLWAGLDNGIDFLEVSSPLSLYRNGKVIGTGYAAIMHNDLLYLGTNTGLYCRPYQEGDWPENSPNFELVENSDGQVWSLQEVGGELICGHNKGTYRVVGKKAELLSNVEGGWKYLYKKEFPNKMIGGTYTGLVLFERSTDGKWKYVSRIEGFNESSRELYWDSDNSIWMSHGYKGVYRIYLDDSFKKVEKFRFYGQQDGFTSNLNINVQPLRGDKVFSSNSGFYRYVEELDRFEKHKSLNNLLGKEERVKKMVEDLRGDIWFFQGKDVGLLKLQFDKSFEIKRKPFARLSGSFISGFENITFIDKENVLLGTEQGFVHYNSKITPHHDVAFQVMIREVGATQGTDSVIYYGANVQSKAIQFSGDGKNLIQLPFRKNAIRFRFSAPALEYPGVVKYRYQLEGFEEEPSAWSSSTVKEYTNLPEGQYVFKVFAENEYGVKGRTDEFHFTILPPWYRTRLAYGVYILLLLFAISGVVALVRLRMRKIQENLKREQVQELQRKELKHREEALVAEKEIIKLRNDKLRSEVEFKNRELASSTMNIIHKNEVLSYAQTELKNALKKIKDPTALVQVRKLVKTIEGEFNSEKDWEQFEVHFDRVHENFLKKLRNEYSQLTPKDLRMCAYLRMNLSSKEIAPLMNISVRGVEISRYRLRKKFGLNREDNLIEFIFSV